MVGLFSKKKRRNDPAEMELFSRAHRSIQLKDSEEEKSEALTKNKLKTKRTVRNFQRLDPSKSEDSTPSFDVSNQTPKALQVVTDAFNGPNIFDVEETLPGTGKTHKLKLMIGGSGSSNRFRRLSNMEGSHASYAYAPPTDYPTTMTESFNYSQRKPSASSSSSLLKLQQIASQSFVPPPQDEMLDEIMFHQSPTDNAPLGEFRQFVFDKDFSTIEAVNVEKSDSGVGDADIFRMAAVATVSRMTLEKNRFSPQTGTPSLSSTAPSKAFSPFSGVPPKSSHQRGKHLHFQTNKAKKAIEENIHRGEIKTLPKPPNASTPDSYTNSHSSSKGLSSVKESDLSSENFSKKRFQELVHRNGKFSPSPTTQTTHTSSRTFCSNNSITKNSNYSDDFSQTQLWDRAQVSLHRSNGQRVSSRATTTTKTLGDVSCNTISEVKKQAASPKVTSPHPSHPSKTLSRRVPKNDPKNPMTSPLQTHRQFGNTAVPGRVNNKSATTTAARRYASNTASSLLASSSHHELLKPRPPKTIAATSEFSVISSVSATVSTGPDENRMTFGAHEGFHDCRLHHFDLDDDPFKIGEDSTVDDSAWDIDKAPVFKPRRGKAATTISTAASRDNSSLIESIQQAAKKNPRGSDKSHHTREYKPPDPSPRGIHQSLSDSVLDFTPAQDGGRRSIKRNDPDDIVKTMSDGALERDKICAVERDTFGALERDAVSGLPQVPPAGVRSTSKTPSGVPENAILASMLFRQTEVFSRGEQDQTLRTSKKSKPSLQYTESPSDPRFEVPPAIHTSSAASVVSSVTEEASTFYQKNFQSFKSQAHSALNNYNNIRSKQQTNHYSSSQALNQKHWVSSSSSRKTASSTGRPTWLDRVEEEHMRMFNG